MMSPLPPSAKLSDRQSLSDTTDIKMAGMLFTSILFLLDTLHYLIANETKVHT